jgi:hypothetical protein
MLAPHFGQYLTLDDGGGGGCARMKPPLRICIALLSGYRATLAKLNSVYKKA